MKSLSAEAGSVGFLSVLLKYGKKVTNGSRIALSGASDGGSGSNVASACDVGFDPILVVVVVKSAGKFVCASQNWYESSSPDVRSTSAPSDAAETFHSTLDVPTGDSDGLTFRRATTTA